MPNRLNGRIERNCADASHQAHKRSERQPLASRVQRRQESQDRSQKRLPIEPTESELDDIFLQCIRVDADAPTRGAQPPEAVLRI
jgi:hypothetical protein